MLCQEGAVHGSFGKQESLGDPVTHAMAGRRVVNSYAFMMASRRAKANNILGNVYCACADTKRGL